jgi:hypothetical protein
LEEMLDKSNRKPFVHLIVFMNIWKLSKHVLRERFNVMVEKAACCECGSCKTNGSMASKYNIHLLTNYETTWYGSNANVVQMLDSIGDLRKIVVHDGHQGPKRNWVSKEFFEWLTDL